MKRFVFLLAAVLMAVPALAQQTQGDTELQVQGSVIISTKSSGSDTGLVDVVLGRFLTDQQEVGIRNATQISGDLKLDGSVGPFYRLNFGRSKTVPFVGASAAVTYGDKNSGQGVINFEGGLRHFLSSRAAFSLEGVYTYDIKQKEFQDFVGVLFGFSYLWGK